jgi:hypothetical protein
VADRERRGGGPAERVAALLAALVLLGLPCLIGCLP